MESTEDPETAAAAAAAAGFPVHQFGSTPSPSTSQADCSPRQRRKMGLIRIFCGCCNLRSGSMFAAIYSLLSSCFYMGLILVRYVGYRFVQTSDVHAVVTYMTFGFYGFLAITAIVLIVAVHMDRHMLFFPWMIQVILTMILGTATMVWVLIANIQDGQEIEPWEVGILIVHIGNVVMSSYCLFCVVSQYQDLAQGKGTQQYYRRRRRRRRSSTVGTLVPGDPGSESNMAGLVNMAMSNEQLQDMTGGFVRQANIPVQAPPYCELPPAYSTLPREDRPPYPPPYNQAILALDPTALTGTGAATGDRPGSPLPAPSAPPRENNQSTRATHPGRATREIGLPQRPMYPGTHHVTLESSQSSEVYGATGYRGARSYNNIGLSRETSEEYIYCEIGALPF